MSDSWNLNWTQTDGTSITIERSGGYTIASVERSVPGQFEQTQNTTESGEWLEPPQLEQDGNRSIVTIVAVHGRFEIEIDGLNVEVHIDDSAPPSPLPLTATPLFPIPVVPPSDLTCGQCGCAVGRGDRFCSQCGAPL
ncbi:MAG: hypothetical protein ACFB9N_10090 [Geitlerinemataceae cyanobacterium]